MGTFTLGMIAVVQIQVRLFLAPPAAFVWFHTHLIQSNSIAFAFNLCHHKCAQCMSVNRM